VIGLDEHQLLIIFQSFLLYVLVTNFNPRDRQRVDFTMYWLVMSSSCPKIIPSVHPDGTYGDACMYGRKEHRYTRSLILMKVLIREEAGRQAFTPHSLSRASKGRSLSFSIFGPSPFIHPFYSGRDSSAWSINHP